MTVDSQLNELISTWATPVLKRAGFARRGRKYVISSDRGDYAILDFRAWSASPAVAAFYLHISVAPATYLEWVQQVSGARVGRYPGREDAVVFRSVIAPHGAWYGEFETTAEPHLWGFTDETAGRCGRLLAEVLEHECLPILHRLLDRSQLLAELHNPETDLISVVTDVAVAEAIVRSDEQLSPELDRLLGRLAATGRDDDVVAWVRARVG